MIDLNKSKRYCTDYTKIENYEQAINDDTQTWICHHKNGIILNCSRKELKDMGLYYDRPPEELIFLTLSEHTILHRSGKKHSEETRKKQSDAHKGAKLTEETRKNQSKAKSGSKNPAAKQCTIDGKTYGCIKDAYRDICPEVTYNTFRWRYKNNYYN